ncbi:MAG: nucleoside 2-deoxyribosyltransferase [Candidatus Woesearchaeota archaeon]|jgi:nucleoside 2-deoxyribosyltransferase|nr:nucleoside 2-deoxyribosyltransferase [Candidatus Woesearchaeota archaeon]MDP7182120.1 nucleoside 2-deoxyribosyltransferase [Candidatus Woesearchaeota archaeon]MDP7199291.1 nucleoside 2-deoxyribosyltransferase [Candidatus Woesearchaeota archaeon]MDP7467912.1 nucleoside 2-deoxyribosyltransferase [Candidatus Woesearchaeota archaeon]MDP7647882.1 nucleoside 2-deoxyribosyltransferase [Candidatus Woesearchaeota archaeon]
MKAYLAVKFHEDRNKALIEGLSEALNKAGITTTVMVRDHEKWGEVKFSPNELMKLAFSIIDRSDMVMVEFSEKGVGLGIEAGYAHAKNIPVIVIAKENSEISNTLRGIAKEVIFYETPEELTEKMSHLSK